MDPSKLKVVELRAELASRGLDQKGVKAVLVERLEKALEDEGGDSIVISTNESTEPGDSGNTESNDSPELEEDEEHIDDQPEEHEEDDDQNPDNYEVNDEVGEDDIKEESVCETNETSSSKPLETIKEENDEPMNMETDKATIKEEEQDANNEELKKEEEIKEEKGTVNKDKDARRSDSASRKNRKRGRSRSPRRGDHRSPARNHPAKNTDDFTKEEEEPQIDESTLLLSWYDSDIHLEIEPDFENAKPLSDAALSLVWAGARGTHGVKNGRVLYEIQLTGHNQFYNNFPDEKDLYELRVGWSTLKSNLQLGESPQSFSYASSGKKAVNNEFSDYGIRYELDDVIGAYLDLESTPCKIEFTVNGKSQGVAFQFEKSELEDEALFPHIISKNTVFRVNFGQIENGMLPLIKQKKNKQVKDGKREKRDRRDSKRSDAVELEKKEKPIKEDEVTKNKGEDNPQEEKSVDESNVERSTELMEDPKETDIKETEIKESEIKVTEIKVTEIEETEITETEIKETEVKDTEIKETPTETVESAMETDENVSKSEEIIEPTVILELLEDYVYINKISENDLVAGPKRPTSRSDCEVIMMVGLPGAGKTHWANNFAVEHPDKRYNILGNTALIERMKVNGEERRKCHVGKWDRLIEWCNRALIVLQDIATRRRRNFILDQTNVFASAQRRKMRGFGEFKRIAVVVIPEEEDYKQRYDKKIENEGKEVPDTALNEMKANFAMPTTEYGWFTEIRCTDLSGEAAQKAIDEFNDKGRKALPPPTKRRRFDDRRRDQIRRNNDRNRWGDRRRNDRYGGGGGSGYDRRGSGSGYDRRDRGWNGGNGSSNWSGSRRGPSSRFDDRRGGSGRDHDRDRRDYRPRDRSRGRSSGARDDKKRDTRRVSSDRNRNGSSNNNWGSGGQHWGEDQFGGWGGNFQNQGYGGQTNWANNGWGNWGSNQWGNAQNSSTNTGQWKNYGTSSSGNAANAQQWMNYWQQNQQ